MIKYDYICCIINVGDIFLSKGNNHLDMIVIQTLVRTFQRHPLAANCSAYALFSASAELIQQHFEARPDGVKKVCICSFYHCVYCVVICTFPTGIRSQGPRKIRGFGWLHFGAVTLRLVSFAGCIYSRNLKACDCCQNCGRRILPW